MLVCQDIKYCTFLKLCGIIGANAFVDDRILSQQAGYFCMNKLSVMIKLVKSML